MPLARYFLFVGGVLLALLFISDAYLPKLPVSNRANSHSAIIRIHSDQKWPERVVFDTTQTPVAPKVTEPQTKAALAGPEPAPEPTGREASRRG